MQKKLIAVAVAGLASAGVFAQSSVEITGNVDMSAVLYTGSYSGRVEGTQFANTTAALLGGLATGAAPNAYAINGVYNGVGKSAHTYLGTTMNGVTPATEFGSRAELQSAQRSTSKITFKGTEDLGGGLKAFFVLTSNIAGDGGTANGANANPTANIIGNRESSVGLTSNTWGTLKAGRMTIMMDDALEPFTNNGVGAYGNLLILPSVTRANNVIHYESPKWNGATFIYEYAMAENSDRLQNTSGQGSITDIGVYYDNGPLTVRAHHMIARDYGNGLTANTVSQANGTSLTAFANTTLTEPTRLVTLQHQARSLWVNYLAASYDFKVLKLFGTYVTTQSSKTASDTASAASKQAQIDCANAGILCWVGYEAPIVNSSTYNIGIDVPFGAHGIQASWTGVNDKRVWNQDARQAALGYTYQLSKRTEFYARGAKVYNTNGAPFSVTNSGTGASNGVGIAAMGGSAAMSNTLGNNGRTTGYTFGMNHKF